MARKSSRRSHSRKMKHTKKHSRHHSRRRHTRRRGGDMNAVRGAPVNYALAGDWSSRMSLGQGGDFFKYHQGQHGGEAPVGSIGKLLIDPSMQGPAMTAGTFKAYADIAGLKDQAGGKRRRHRKSSKKSKKSKSRKSKSRKSRKGGSKRRSTRKTRHRRRRGGALGYSPTSASSMLLSGPDAYAKAGLNPGWKNDIAFADAKQREGM